MSEPATAWAEAFAKAQAEFPAIHKDKTATIETKKGGQYRYSYADLPTILEQVNPVLQKHGLAVGQSVVGNGDGVGVETRIYHKAGHVEVFGPVFLPAGEDARSAGSGITYSRRYSLCAALGIATDEDDDGAAATRETGARTGGRTAGEPTRSSTDGQNPSGPHCPACYHINGEIVEVWENDKKPYQKCKNKPDECAGATPDKDGKLWSWSGWHKDWEDSRDEWVEQNDGVEGFSSEEPPEQSPTEWLKLRVAKFSKWDKKQKEQAYHAVVDELALDGEDGRVNLTDEKAKQILKGMEEAYTVEFPPSPDEAVF